MKKIHLLLLLLGTVLRFQTINSINSPIRRIDHLPSNIKPESYDLFINVDFKNNDVPFSGNVGITIECVKSTDTIVLNLKDLKIDDVKVTPPIEVTSLNHVILKDQFIITLAEKLKAGEKYEVNVLFKKKSLVDLSDFGLIRYGYRRESSSSKEMTALTKSDINDARRFFPCLDQMNMKAKFKVQLKVPEHMVGLSSLKFRKLDESSENQRVFEYEDSIPISTYSFGLAVAEVVSEGSIAKTTGIPIKIWFNAAIPQFSNRKIFINMITEEVFHFYLSYFDSPPSISSLDLVILPDLREFNTEKFGMIMLDELTIMSSEPQKAIDDDTKANITQHLCYEISRQWLGASVTMSNWNEYWVQLALATFLRDPCLNELFQLPGEKTPNLLDPHLVETFTQVLRNDVESVSRPIYVDKEDFDLTGAFADRVLFDKAHLLIRMMHYFLGKNVLRDSLREYYKASERGNSSLDKVWEVFNEIASTQKNLIPQHTTIKEIMESWVRKKGHPVINMDIDYENGKAVLKQERFVHLEDMEDDNKIIRNNDYWIIPINYTTKTQFKERENPRFPVDLWLTDKNEVTISPIPKEWTLLNTQLHVPCRVNYDRNTRKLLYETLMNKDEYTIIDEKSRVQLVADMFALAEVGRMPYHTLLSTMKYLIHEDSDLVLMVALYEFKRIHSTLFDSKLIKFYENYVKKILENIFEKTRFAQFDGNKSEKQLKKLVIELSCNFRVQKCIEQYTNLENDDSIPEDIREIFYCQFVKHGSQASWQFLYNQYNKHNTVSQNKVILTALGCSENLQILEGYLSQFLNHEFPPKYNESIITGLASNEAGYRVMKELFLSNYEEIIQDFEGYKDTIGFYLAKLLEFTNTNKDFNELKGIMDSVKDQLRDVENILEESVRKAKRNFIWLEKHEKVLKHLLQYPYTLDSMDVFPQGLSEMPTRK